MLHSRNFPMRGRIGQKAHPLLSGSSELQILLKFVDSRQVHMHLVGKGHQS